MSRLPQPGSDEGTWGDVLNEYLSVMHNNDGTLRSDSIVEQHLDSAIRTKLNQVSPPGPTGPQGPKGDTGAAGTTDWDGITNKPVSFTPSAHTHTAVDISDATTIGRTVLTAADAAAVRSAIGAGTSDWNDITNKPVSFTPSAHTHTAVDISDATTIGRTILTAADAAAVRSASGAGTSNLTLGTTSTTAAAGDHSHPNYLTTKNGISNITDSTNDMFAHINITDDASNTANWPDRLAFYFSGIRSGYHNEYGELRARPAKSNTVALRAMKWASASTVDIFQVANTDATTLYFTVGPTSMTASVPLASTAAISTTSTVSASNIGNKVTASATAPASPGIGDVWVDLS